MSQLTHTFMPAAARGAFPLTRVVIVTAALAGLAGLMSLTGLLAAMPPANTDNARPAPREMTMPSAQPTGMTHAGTTVPDASAVFAEREEEAVEEPAPTF